MRLFTHDQTFIPRECVLHHAISCAHRHGRRFTGWRILTRQLFAGPSRSPRRSPRMTFTPHGLQNVSSVILTLSKCTQILHAYEDCVSKRKSDHEVGVSNAFALRCDVTEPRAQMTRPRHGSGPGTGAVHFACAKLDILTLYLLAAGSLSPFASFCWVVCLTRDVS